MYLVVIIIALSLDYLFGEPKRYHPLIGFGNLAARLENRLNIDRLDNKLKILLGAVAVVIAVAPWVLLTYFVADAISNTVWLLDILVLYWAIGLRSLQQHTEPIQQALNEKKFEQAQHHLSRIVSRDTDRLNEQQITSATVESTLENGSDCLFGVVFCYLLGGAVLVVCYRLINTLDAMWGYRTDRYEYFGKVAARLDDVLNYVPARLTALSYAVCGEFSLAINSWRSHAKLLSSPNAGPVMSAGAGSLNLRLGGPTYYHGKLVDKPYFGGSKQPDVNDIKRANQLVARSLLVWCAAILLSVLVFEFLG